LVKAIIALEPGEFAFPADAMPDDVPTTSDLLRSYMAPQVISVSDFRTLISIPILIVMGDNIAREPHDEYEIELWRVVRERAQQFAVAANDRGGQVTYLDLPDIGIYGNTHFPMSDLNNVQVACVIEDFLARHGLDGADLPHRGPTTASV
jgi:hypothetical protein